MGQIEREIKVLNVDVNHIKSTLKKKGIEPKGKFIQDVYTFDLPTVDELYAKYVETFLKNNDITQFLTSKHQLLNDFHLICLNIQQFYFQTMTHQPNYLNYLMHI